MNIGIFGGSFDPPHVCHVLLAAYALSVEALDRLLIVPVYQHALGKALAPFEHRVRMCELAFADLKRVEVSTLERDLGGVSRTLRLVEALEQRYPGARFRLVVGADILQETARWHRFDEVERRAPLLVIGRSGVPLSVENGVPELPNVSSTAVRAALAQGNELNGWLPRRVSDYAAQHRLYAPDDAP